MSKKKYLLIQKFSSLLYFVEKLLNNEKVKHDLPFKKEDISIIKNSHNISIGIEVNNGKTKITFKYIDNYCDKIQVTTEEEPTFTNTITISSNDEYYKNIEYGLLKIIDPEKHNIIYDYNYKFF